MRHGHVESHGGKRYRGQTDHPLSDLGRKQAQHWRAWFAPIRLGAIISSDLCRARETARIIADSQRIARQIDPRLREINLGAWEGLAIATLRQHYPRAFAQRGQCFASYRVPLGESFQDVQQRVMPAFWQGVARAVNDPILIVAHAGVNRTILCRLLHKPLDRLFDIRQDYASLNILETDPDKRIGTVKSINLGVHTDLPDAVFLHR